MSNVSKVADRKKNRKKKYVSDNKNIIYMKSNPTSEFLA